MSRPSQPEVGVREVLYFLAEVAVYVAVAWWAFTRELAPALRWLLAIGLVAAFAIPWALLASPKARWPLPGWADTMFRIVWFGLGFVAAVLASPLVSLG